MTAIDNAKLAMDANFDINGFDAEYYSTWPGTAAPCRILPKQDDIELGLETARATQARAEFVVRRSEIVPAQGGFIVIAGIRYRINEAPQPDDLRLVYALKCVKA